MDEPIIDEPFFITADIGQGEQEFFVIPDWDEEKGESNFTILADGIELGTLNCVDVEEWDWISSGLTKLEAMILGNKIDNHYS